MVQCHHEQHQGHTKDADMAGGLPTGGVGAGGFSGINNIMSNMSAVRDGMASSTDPIKSLGWYKDTLNTQMSLTDLYAYLTRFYDELDRYGVRHA